MLNPFPTLEYDPLIYKNFEDAFIAGKKVKYEKWAWNYTPATDKEGSKSEKKILESGVFSTISEFNSKIWDSFADFARKNTYPILWGAFGLENRNPEKPKNIYCDGYIFFLMKKEFLGCLENECVARFLSCLEHVKFENLDFTIIKE